MQISELNRAVREVRLLAWVIAGVSVLGAFAQFYLAMQKDHTITRLSTERPVMVVPGAVAGEYIAGLSDENLVLAARYLASLGTVFTTANVDSRLGELEGYASPSFLPRLQEASERLRAEVRSQNQSRSFIFDRGQERLTRNGEYYVYEVNGARAFFSGGFVMQQDTGSVRMRFRLGAPDARNKLGVLLEDVTISAATSTAAPRGAKS
jgi:hypothetical protein